VRTAVERVRRRARQGAEARPLGGTALSRKGNASADEMARAGAGLLRLAVVEPIAGGASRFCGDSEKRGGGRGNGLGFGGRRTPRPTLFKREQRPSVRSDPTIQNDRQGRSGPAALLAHAGARALLRGPASVAGPNGLRRPVTE
jgi:hypothetical protein